MELKEGMYIRTKEGLRKIEDTWEDTYDLNRGLHNRYPEGHCLYEEDIEEVVLKEPSFNPIDLIEVGDYVNGGLVEMKQDNYIMVGFADYEELRKLYNRDIKSIVTKEQFSSMEYRIGE